MDWCYGWRKCYGWKVTCYAWEMQQTLDFIELLRCYDWEAHIWTGAGGEASVNWVCVNSRPSGQQSSDRPRTSLSERARRLTDPVRKSKSTRIENSSSDQI